MNSRHFAKFSKAPKLAICFPKLESKLKLITPIPAYPANHLFVTTGNETIKCPLQSGNGDGRVELQKVGDWDE